MSRVSYLLACVIAITASFAGTVSAQDVINIDISQVDPSAIPAVREAEAIWEARIKAYSTELPRAIRDQLGALSISATVAPVDGVGGILGFAGPDAVLTVSRSDFVQPSGPGTRVPQTQWAVAVRSSMTFDLDDFPSLIADGILVSVIAHEMGHAMGFGTLFDTNDLAAPRNGFGLTQYIGGQYAIEGFRNDIGNPLTSFVPLEQRGGPGTALGHWIDAPPFFNRVFTADFTKEIMTGFAGDLDPATGTVVFAPTFVSEATWGAFADLGFAVDGINGAFAAKKGAGTGRWPKTVGSGTNPFDANGIPAAAELNFSIVSVKASISEALGSKGSGAGDVDAEEGEDPYSLRKLRWADGLKK